MDSIARESLLLHAFGWWQFAVCLFAFAALMTIWWHLGRKKGDHGQVWLAISVLCWSLSGLGEVYYSQTILQAEYIELSKSNLASLKSILSLSNSFFILMALPYFRYLPGRFNSIIASEFWKFIVGIPFVLAIAPIIAKHAFGRQYNFINDLDVYYSILTLIFLGAVLWESFARRNLKLLSILSLICIVVTFVAQLFKPIDNTINQLIFSAIFKSCLIMIFFALALSWVKEIVEKANLVKQIVFDPTKMFVQMDKPHAIIHGMGDNQTHQVKLTHKQFSLLSSLIERRLRDVPKEQWLSIKPKNAPPEKHYDIPHENDITRLLEALLDGIFGKGEWDKKNVLPDFRKSLLKRMNGKVSLGLLTEHVK